MTHRPSSVRATFILVVLNALMWLAFGMIVASGAHPAIPDDPLIKWGMALLAFLCSACLLGLLPFLARRRRFAYYLTLAILGITSFAIFGDQFGLADLVVLAVTIAPLVLLIKDRAWYLEASLRPRRS